MKKVPAFAVVLATLCFALVACSGSDPTPTTAPIATADVDATVRVSVQQTTVANEAIESTVAAAISATRTAEANQVIPTPTSMPVPTASPVVTPTTVPTPVPTPTAVTSGIEVTDFTCVVLYPGIPLLEGDTIDLAANGKMTNRTGMGQFLTGITVIVFGEGNIEMARSAFEPQNFNFPQDEPLNFSTTIPESMVRNATECEVYFDLTLGSQPTTGEPRVPVEFIYAP